MARAVAFFSWTGIVLLVGLVAGTLMAWMDGSYTGSLTQWLLHETIQAVLLGLCVWGALWSWRKRRALPPAERSQAGMGCLVVICACLAAIMYFVLSAKWTNRKVAEDTKALAPPVIAALDRYKAANKDYPRTLDELVPQYLPALPLCKLGDDRPKLAYRREGAAGYELACPASMLMMWRYRYRSETGDWSMVD